MNNIQATAITFCIDKQNNYHNPCYVRYQEGHVALFFKLFDALFYYFKTWHFYNILFGVLLISLHFRLKLHHFMKRYQCFAKTFKFLSYINGKYITCIILGCSPDAEHVRRKRHWSAPTLVHFAFAFDNFQHLLLVHFPFLGEKYQRLTINNNWSWIMKKDFRGSSN